MTVLETIRVRPCRPPRSPAVLVSAPPDLTDEVDWRSWYLTDEEDMGESPEQGGIIRTLVSILEQMCARRGWQDIYIGADNFFAWIEEEPMVRVSPDVYVLRNPIHPLPGSWQTWLPGHHAPELAFEVVSEDWRKDYDEAPAKYAMLGVGELVIFDPAAAAGITGTPDRVPIQIYRRTEDGLFVRRESGDGPFLLRTVDLHVFCQIGPQGPLLRLSVDAAGRDPCPTADEALAASEEGRAAAEEGRARAEARAEALQRELDRLSGGSSS